MSAEVPAHIAKVRAEMRAELLREIKRRQRLERVQDPANELWHGSAWSDLFGRFEADLGWDK